MNAPPQHVIDAAIAEANRSPCAKSKRGVVVFGAAQEGALSLIIGRGHNGLPAGECVGKMCFDCNKRAVHAEDRAIRDALVTLQHVDAVTMYDALHVKTVDGQLVWSGGPSCWQCSRTVLDVGLSGFWLYERKNKQYECPYSDRGKGGLVDPNDDRTGGCRYCSRDKCMRHPALEIAMEAYRSRSYRDIADPQAREAEKERLIAEIDKACGEPGCTQADAHLGLPPVETHWVRYTAEEFHRVTLEACNLV